MDDLVPVPLIALPGEPIGIITIEDVIEELMQVMWGGGEGTASLIRPNGSVVNVMKTDVSL